MRRYEVKRGHGKTLEKGGLRKRLAENFDGVSDKGDWHVASYGALQQVTVRMVSKSEIELDSQLDTTASLEVATDTHKRFNKFLETVTGFGVSLIVGVPLLLGLGYTAFRSALISILALTIGPWGSMASIMPTSMGGDSIIVGTR